MNRVLFCFDCNQDLPIEHFSPSRSKAGVKRSICRPCASKRQLMWARAHPDETKEKLRANYRKKRKADESAMGGGIYCRKCDRVLPELDFESVPLKKRRCIRRVCKACKRGRLRLWAAEWRNKNKAIVKERIARSRNVNPSLIARRGSKMPPWANRKAIKEIYAEARRLTRETGIVHEVDHVIPLVGRNVCGLHVETNMQILTRFQNRSKRNRIMEAA